jgi:malonyl-ACP O-methyltransferase BioC
LVSNLFLFIQKQACHYLLKGLQTESLPTQMRILDAGCGTGHASAALMKKYPKAELVSLDLALGMLWKTQLVNASLANRIKRVFGQAQQNLLCADIEQLPLADASVDMIFSNLAIQWCNDLDAAFAGMHRVLRTDGLLTFSTLGPDTLKELRAASKTNAERVSVSRFFDMHDIGDALVRAGFSAPVLDVERVVLTYDDAIDVMPFQRPVTIFFPRASICSGNGLNALIIVRINPGIFPANSFNVFQAFTPKFLIASHTLPTTAVTVSQFLTKPTIAATNNAIPAITAIQGAASIAAFNNH